MAAITADLHVDREVSITTSLQEVVFGDGVSVVWLVASAAAYVSRDDTKADGDAISATARFRVPADLVFPIRNSGRKTFIAAVTGTATANIHGSDS